VDEAIVSVFDEAVGQELRIPLGMVYSTAWLLSTVS
jgi:hypothetical protein